MAGQLVDCECKGNTKKKMRQVFDASFQGIPVYSKKRDIFLEYFLKLIPRNGDITSLW